MGRRTENKLWFGHRHRPSLQHSYQFVINLRPGLILRTLVSVPRPIFPLMINSMLSLARQTIHIHICQIMLKLTMGYMNSRLPYLKPPHHSYHRDLLLDSTSALPRFLHLRQSLYVQKLTLRISIKHNIYYLMIIFLMFIYPSPIFHQPMCPSAPTHLPPAF